MALGGALVDRARRLRKEQAQKVNGETQMVPTTGPWFRARFVPAPAPELVQNGKVRVAKVPTLLCGVRDVEGGKLHDEQGKLLIDSGDKLEVFSRDLGSGLYQITGEPQILRKKRRVIGYVFALRRVEEPQAIRGF